MHDGIDYGNAAFPNPEPTDPIERYKYDVSRLQQLPGEVEEARKLIKWSILTLGVTVAAGVIAIACKANEDVLAVIGAAGITLSGAFFVPWRLSSDELDGREFSAEQFRSANEELAKQIDDAL